MQNRLNKKILVLLPILLLSIIMSLIGCSATNGLPVQDSTSARDEVLNYLNDKYDENIPDQNSSWQEEDKTPSDITGIAIKSYTSEAWTILVSYPLVKPDLTIYTVTLVNNNSGWKWEGKINANGTVNETSPLEQITQDESRQIAEDFVKNCPTFNFDGMEDTFKYIDTVTLRTPFGWQFTFEFQSRHAGYGDRTGQMLAEVITTHTAVITVIRAQITTATLDNKWDILEQKMITSSESEEEGKQIAGDFVKNCPTFKFDGIADTLKLAETLYPDIENAWQFVFQFESAHAGYGDRTGQNLIELITSHEAIITVENGAITNAIMDEKWDMINQKTFSDIELSLASIHEVEIYFMESYPVQIGIRIKGGLRDGCTTFHNTAVTRDGNVINIEVIVQKPMGMICPAIYTFFEESLNLGSDFTTGTTYTIHVNDFTDTFVYP